MGDEEALNSLLHQVKSKMAFRYDVMKLEGVDDDDNADDMLSDAQSIRWNDHKTANSVSRRSSKSLSKNGQAANEKNVKATQRRESVKQATRDALGVSLLRKSMSDYGVEER